MIPIEVTISLTILAYFIGATVGFIRALRIPPNPYVYRRIYPSASYQNPRLP
jgi:uncharacterized membrane protein